MVRCGRQSEVAELKTQSPPLQRASDQPHRAHFSARGPVAVHSTLAIVQDDVALSHVQSPLHHNEPAQPPELVTGHSAHVFARCPPHDTSASTTTCVRTRSDQMMALGIWNMGEARAAAGEACGWGSRGDGAHRLVGLTGRGEGGGRACASTLLCQKHGNRPQLRRTTTEQTTTDTTG